MSAAATSKKASSKKPPQLKDWRKAVGMLRDTKLAREADALGRQYRAEQVKP